MTKKDAKELTLEVWRYLMWHPWIVDKAQISNKLYQKIVGLFARCPLCEFFIDCYKGCPLKNCGNGSSYTKWDNAITMIGRFIGASQIVRKVKKWKV